mgnify:CR=1 FL=1
MCGYLVVGSIGAAKVTNQLYIVKDSRGRESAKTD